MTENNTLTASQVSLSPKLISKNNRKIDWDSIIPSYEEMLASGMHFGRKKSVKHPKMDPYIYALKDSIHIINLFSTVEKLKEAGEFMRNVKDSGGVILWVSLSKVAEKSIIEIAKKLSMPYIKEHWIGGTLTNFVTIRKRIDYYIDKKTKYENQEYMANLTKKERYEFEKELKVLNQKFEGMENLIKIPEVIFLTSLRRGDLAVREARKVGVKIVAISNTDSDITKVDYPIPANDNARKSVQMILEILEKALLY